MGRLLESSTSGQNITNLANVRPATDESYYNVRGERIAIAQHTQYAYGSVADTVRAFSYDGNGQILTRCDGTANGNAIDQGSDPSLKNQHYVYVNGQQIAHYDEKSTLDVLSQVTAFSSGTGSGDYVVQEGDTLKSIAQAVYGKANLWYIVAPANALTGDSDLAAGLSPIRAICGCACRRETKRVQIRCGDLRANCRQGILKQSLTRSPRGHLLSLISLMRYGC
ncbi:hypothetical protein ABIE56_003706 [Luteibacter sp. 621]|uniref:LysM peptidoglycan-binding domain-containing protein n=1 Tax=Luteibacter sp. 621 TaxID=3373916 RepID=UPI003D1B2FE1